MNLEQLVINTCIRLEEIAGPLSSFTMREFNAVLTAAFDEVRRAAVEAERERAAQIAEYHADNVGTAYLVCSQIAALIRAAAPSAPAADTPTRATD